MSGIERPLYRAMVCAVLVVLMCATRAWANVGEIPVRVSIPDTLVLPADTVLVPVRVTDVTGLDILAAEIVAVYDSRVVKALGVETAGSMSDMWLAGSSVKAGQGNTDTLRIGISTAHDALDGAGTLVFIKMAVKTIGEPGTTDLKLMRVLLNEGQPAAVSQSGSLKLGARASLVNAEAFYSEIRVSIRVDNVAGWGVTGVEFHVAFDPAEVGFLGVETTGGLAETGWLAATNVVSGAGSMDTLKVAMSTAQDTLIGSGDLVFVKMKSLSPQPPDSSELRLTRVIFNEGLPGAFLKDGWVYFTGVAAIPDTAATSGSSVLVPVRISDVTGLGILAAEISIAYDNTVLSALGVVTGGSQTNGWFGDTTVKTGTGGVDTLLVLLSTAQDTLRGSGDLVYLNLKIANLQQPASTALEIKRMVFNENGAPAVFENGSLKLLGTNGTVETSRVVQAMAGRGGRDTVRVSVVDSDLNRNATLPDTAWVEVENTTSGEIETVKAVEIATSTGIFFARLPATGASVSNDGAMGMRDKDVLIATYTDSLNASGNVSAVIDTTQVVDLFGDVTGNGAVAAFDVSGILQLSVGLTPASAHDSLVADVDGDKVLLAFDASVVMQYVVQLINRFPVQTLVFSSSTKNNHPFLKPAVGQPVVSIGRLQVGADETYRFPVEVDERAGIVSGMLELGYPADAKITAVTAAERYQEYMFVYRSEPGRAWVAFAGAGNEAAGPGAIAQVHLQQKLEGPKQPWLLDVRINGQPQPVLTVEETVPANSPPAYALYPNLPNPFNPETTIRYDLPERSEVLLVVYNLLGQKVRVLVSGHQKAGHYRVMWNGKDQDGRNVGSGVYLVRVEAEGFMQTRKMLLLR